MGPLTTAALAIPAQAQAPSRGGADNGSQTKLIESCEDGSFETVPVFYADPDQISIQLSVVNALTSGVCGGVIGTNTGSPKSVMIYGSPNGRE